LLLDALAQLRSCCLGLRRLRPHFGQLGIHHGLLCQDAGALVRVCPDRGLRGLPLGRGSGQLDRRMMSRTRRLGPSQSEIGRGHRLMRGRCLSTPG
jgi:hypothetical protein